MKIWAAVAVFLAVPVGFGIAAGATGSNAWWWAGLLWTALAVATLARHADPSQPETGA
jgi:hypothetical protein